MRNCLDRIPDYGLIGTIYTPAKGEWKWNDEFSQLDRFWLD
jgi:hypothetical protein